MWEIFEDSKDIMLLFINNTLLLLKEVERLRYWAFIFVFLIQLLLISGCSVSTVEIGPKKEVNSYSEKTVEVKASPEVNMSCDSSNIEVYTWDKKDVKFEITKRVRGVQDKETLEKKLEDFKIDLSEKDNKVFFKSEYRGKDKNPVDRSVDIRVYLPKSIKLLNCKLDIGNIKFLDDISGVLNADINMANMEINRFDGIINVKGDVGNVKISNGRISGKSSIVKNIGSISIKAEFKENGEYFFKTETGNIDLWLPQNSKISFESVGSLEVNEFNEYLYPTKVKVSTSMGKIAIKKY